MRKLWLNRARHKSRNGTFVNTEGAVLPHSRQRLLDSRTAPVAETIVNLMGGDGMTTKKRSCHFFMIGVLVVFSKVYAAPRGIGDHHPASVYLGACYSVVFHLVFTRRHCSGTVS